jgi:hypothetical protein
LTKIKRTEKPAKLFEDKTSEEKQKVGALSAAGETGILKKPGQPKQTNKLQFG